MVSTAPRLMSAPMKRRPSFIATACVVPLPMKQSKTRSPGLEEALIIRSMQFFGFLRGVSYTFTFASDWELSNEISVQRLPIRVPFIVFYPQFSELPSLVQPRLPCRSISSRLCLFTRQPELEVYTLCIHKLDMGLAPIDAELTIGPS